MIIRHFQRAALVHRRRDGFTLIEVIVVFLILVVVAALLLPSVGRGREAARRTQCRNNLKEIGLALHHYHDAYGVFPMAMSTTSDGQPLHSWRTWMLPHLDHNSLFQQIDFQQPWSHSINTKAKETRLAVYNCPSDPLASAGQTAYLAPISAHSCLQSSMARTIAQITDGTSNTLAVSEVASSDAAHWMEPHDAAESVLLSYTAQTRTDHVGGRHALLADGSVRFLANNLNPDTLKSLISANCGDNVGDY